jgi:hypothetical protein
VRCVHAITACFRRWRRSSAAIKRAVGPTLPMNVDGQQLRILRIRSQRAKAANPRLNKKAAAKGAGAFYR